MLHVPSQTFQGQLGLLIVFETIVKQSFLDSFFNRFQKQSLRFWKKTIVFENDPLVLNFRKRITIVFENNRFIKTISDRFLNDCFFKNYR